MSVNNVSPQSFLGGTWQAWGAGKVPVGVDPNDTDFNTSNKSGGSKTVTLTLEQIPSHRHGVGSRGVGNDIAASGNNIGAEFLGNYTYSSFFTDYVGNNKAHNNLQPYITCYFWRRTS